MNSITLDDEEEGGLAVEGSEVNENDHVFSGFNNKLFWWLVSLLMHRQISRHYNKL